MATTSSFEILDRGAATVREELGKLRRSGPAGEPRAGSDQQDIDVEWDNPGPAFGGDESALAVDAVIEAIRVISRIGLEHPAINAIEVNPLIVGRNATVAVDCLINVEREPQT